MSGTTRKPLLRCSVCDAELRPYGAPLAKWPGTKGKVSTNPPLCTAHQYGSWRCNARRVNLRDESKVWDWSGHMVETIPVEHARVVRRLIQERFEGDDYMLMTEALGIGDDID